MDARLIFWPAVAMVVLTIIVTFRMFFERSRQIRAEGVRWREVSTSSKMNVRLADTRSADNYRNLFETPTLFYAALIVAFLTAQVNVLTLSLAWIFVASRYLHSAIHTTGNRIRYRLPVFFFSCLMLWVFWGVLALGLLR
ncbi:MAG: MAPEG family protein [Rudaea sp.]